MRQCNRMLDQACKAAPRRVLRLNYLDLVEQPETSLRDLSSRLGVEFEGECLDPSGTLDAIATASSEQVRKGLNREGIGNSGPYAKWLGALGEPA